MENRTSAQKLTSGNIRRFIFVLALVCLVFATVFSQSGWVHDSYLKFVYPSIAVALISLFAPKDRMNIKNVAVALIVVVAVIVAVSFAV